MLFVACLASQGVAETGSNLFAHQCYFATHFIYMMSGWGMRRLDPSLFWEEVNFFLDSFKTGSIAPPCRFLCSIPPPTHTRARAHTSLVSWVVSYHVVRRATRVPPCLRFSPTSKQTLIWKDPELVGEFLHCLRVGAESVSFCFSCSASLGVCSYVARIQHLEPSLVPPCLANC